MKSLLALLLLLSCPAAPAADGKDDGIPRIRVALYRGSPAIKLKTSSRIYVLEVKSGQKYLLLENSAYEIKPGEGGILVGTQRLTSPVKLLAADGHERIRLGGNLYKGDILLRATPEDRLDIIEYLSIEDYLYGVLPVEMSPDWPLEALKAQAVASRTYALRFINPSKDYDVTNGVEMQVYNGTTMVNSHIIEAVNSTRGEVLKYKGKLLTAFFHANCGGHTASSKAAWGADILKPLYGVPDPFCKPSGNSRWELFVPSSDLLRFIQSLGSTALKVKGLKVRQKDRSGRALSFSVATDSGNFTIKASDMRKRLGTREFRSTLITRISPVKGGYELAGRGWGHGVGLCQDGAKYMAYKGRTYKRILRHYYPGAAILDYE
ncbi:MAG: SpoIID/LytB domain-containing protein [Elusimicrobiales bacterium]